MYISACSVIQTALFRDYYYYDYYYNYNYHYYFLSRSSSSPLGWHLAQFMDGCADESNTSVRATQQQVT